MGEEEVREGGRSPGGGAAAADEVRWNRPEDGLGCARCRDAAEIGKGQGADGPIGWKTQQSTGQGKAA